MSQAKRLSMVEKAHPHLSVVEQCTLLKVPRSTHYYKPRSVRDSDLELMKLIDVIFTKWPFYGSRRMTAELKGDGHRVNRKRVQRLPTVPTAGKGFNRSRKDGSLTLRQSGARASDN